MEIFSFPAVYDTAFQFRDAPRAIDFIEWCIKTYAEIPVYAVVDIACGTGHYTREFARRNYRTFGVDINPAICEYAEHRARAESFNITVLQNDMTDFSLPERCDLALSFFDSITYVTDLRAIAEHFETAGRNLNSGGLYILEFGVIDHFENHNIEEVWTEFRRDLSVTSTYLRDSWINPEDHTFEEQCSFRVRCQKHVAFFLVKYRKLALYLDEFDQLVRETGMFTPVAYYDDFDVGSLFDEDFVPWRVVAVLKRS